MEKWIIYDNHLALKRNNEVIHPTAKEIYSCLEDEAQLESLKKDIPNRRFSKIGSPVFCRIVEDQNSSIELSLYTTRKGKNYTLDIIDGKIIDHCINEKEWFFIQGDLDSLSEELASLGIETTGPITEEQYLKIIREKVLNKTSNIENCVSSTRTTISASKEMIPAKLNAHLYPYQADGFKWMLARLQDIQGAILGDEMGLGKTLQVITTIQKLKDSGLGPVLVVAPVSLLENWKRECQKFAPDLNVFIHHGTNRTGLYKDLLHYDVVVVSYNTVCGDLSLLKMINWELVVVDEAQNIKNPFSNRTRSVKELNRNRSLAVTGTPFENHVTDIWSLIDFAIPGLLGSIQNFKKKVPDDVEGAQLIEPVLSPIMIRRMVNDVAKDLPEKIVISQPIKMSAAEIVEYNSLREKAESDLNNGKPLTIGLLQKLRMFCTHPNLIENKFSIEGSVKFQRFTEIAEEIFGKGEKLIVFTSYKAMFEIFREYFSKNFEVYFDCINGDTEVEKRQIIVDNFNNHTGPGALILNPRAAGSGLNITGANHVIHFNLEWNPALEDQASARAYRRGQQKTVFIYRLYYEGTAEEIVNDRIERKREISNTAVIGTNGSLDDKEDILRALHLAPSLY